MSSGRLPRCAPLRSPSPDLDPSLALAPALTPILTLTLTLTTDPSPNPNTNTNPNTNPNPNPNQVRFTVERVPLAELDPVFNLSDVDVWRLRLRANEE